MHISFYKRPLFLLLIFYSLFLVFFLKIPTPKSGDVFYLAPLKKANISAKTISYPVNKKTQHLEVEVLKINGEPAKGRSYLYCRNCPPILRGQIINFMGNISTVEKEENFGSFDWQKYLARKHIFTQIRTNGLVDVKNVSPLWVAISSVRASMLNVFTNNFSGDLGVILSGITIGEKGNIDKTLNTAFQDSGAMHLLVASGGNVAFVTLIVYFLCTLFGVGRKTSAALALLLALFYTLIAGADAPLLRAYLMTLSATAGFILGRKSGVLQGFIIAAFFILLFNPQSIFEAGFQMSFLATLAIILLACNFKLKNSLPRFTKGVIWLFLVSFIAQAALLPIFTNYFHKISFSAALSNIILVPLSGVIMAGGFIVWLVSFLHIDFIFKGLVFLLSQILFIFKILVEFFAGFSLSKFVCGAFGLSSILAYYIVLFGGLNLPIIKHKKRYIFGIFALSFFIALTGILQRPQKQYFLKGKYAFTWLINDGGRRIALGGGVSGEVLQRAVLASGSKKLDCLFLNSSYKSASYALRDIGGLKIETIFLPNSEIAEETQEVLVASKAQIKQLWPGQNACGVKTNYAWFVGEDGEVFKKTEPSRHLSYEFKDIITSGNNQAYFKEGQLNIYQK
ncbi:MAG: ComEC family competence protein [Elusimicrobiota bacterium]|jgi:competence protein ComEC|nr:ComEC family competence protein [Elusimicrobiota bacterium]